MAAAAAVASRLAGGGAARRAARRAARGAANAVPQGMDVSFVELVKEGMEPDAALRYLRSLPGAKREALGMIGQIATNLAGGAAVASAPSLLETILGGRATPASAASPSTGKYFPDPASDLAIEQDYRREMFNRAIAGIFGYKPEYTMRTPAEARAENEARALRMAEDLTRREIEKLRANRAFDVQIEQIARDALIRQAELEALGGVQKQRLESSYGLAQGVLENAIENVLKSGTITDRSAETALAAIQ